MTMLAVLGLVASIIALLCNLILVRRRSLVPWGLLAVVNAMTATVCVVALVSAP